MKCLLQSDQTLTETLLIISDQEKHIFRTNILGQSIEDANCKFFVHFYVGIIWQVLLFTSDTPGGWVFLFQTKNIHCFFPFQRSFFLCMRFSNSHFSTKMSSQSTVWRSSLLKWASSRVWRCACVGNLFLFLFLMSMRQTQTKQQNTTSWT